MGKPSQRDSKEAGAVHEPCHWLCSESRSEARTGQTDVGFEGLRGCVRVHDLRSKLATGFAPSETQFMGMRRMHGLEVR